MELFCLKLLIESMQEKMLKHLILLCFAIYECNAGPLSNQYQHYLELDEVKNFREYVRIDTSKEENLKYAVDFWVRQATELGLPYSVYEPAGKPIFVATWEGANPTLPSIMLNSHMDVVPVDEREWIYPPFSAYMDINGDIYGRGTQDTKDVAIQYVEAIRKLRKDNVTLARTLHLTVMSNEEEGGKYGIKAFVNTPEFKSLNIGFALDEGLASKNETLFATYVDRRPWQMQFVVHGEGGHGLTMPNESAMEKAQRLINAVMTYRETQKIKMRTKSRSEFGELTSVNINMINGGLVPNIIPSSMSLVVDMRLSTSADIQEVQSLVYLKFTISLNICMVNTYIENEAWSIIDDQTNLPVKFDHYYTKCFVRRYMFPTHPTLVLALKIAYSCRVTRGSCMVNTYIFERSTSYNNDRTSQVNSWLHEAGNNTEVTYLRRETESAYTAVDDSNPYWINMRNTLNNMGLKIIPVVCPATSDMLVLRNLGILAIGFTTKTNTTPRLHAKNEYQNVKTFLEGINTYRELIKNLGNVSPQLSLERSKN